MIKLLKEIYFIFVASFDTASLVAVSNGPELRTYYDKKIAEGKHHFIAIADISRKLLTIIYYILKENRDYIRYDSIKNNHSP